MTRDFVTQYWHALEALRDGELEEKAPNNGPWVPVVKTEFHRDPDCYRRKPKKVLRPWTASEAIGKSVRVKGSKSIHVIVSANEDTATIIEQPICYKNLLANLEQADGSPCGVEQ